jgi:SAM-dependent methyltransferase
MYTAGRAVRRQGKEENAVDVVAHNRRAWDSEVARGNPWTVPVSTETIAEARGGRWSVVLTPTKPVPRDWFGDLAGREVLALASAGGQQAPVLAAAGARVTSFDNSPAQLEQDSIVATREGLDVRIELGDMRDLSRFADESFSLIFHPVSNLFVPDVRPVWRECFRVLEPGGRLLAGFANPALFLFDPDAKGEAARIARHRVPYSDLEALPPDEIERRIERGDPLEYGHSLEDQIGGQIEAGFHLAGLFEDGWPEREIGRLIPLFIATLALCPGR